MKAALLAIVAALWFSRPCENCSRARRLAARYRMPDDEIPMDWPRP